MSLNTAHANNGVLIHAGEYILLFSDKVQVEFIGQDNPVFKGTKEGRIYLTSHRMIFNAKNQSEALQSFSFPFITLNDVEVEQPVLGANYIKGKCRSQPNGNWTGEVKFKLYFKGGGAIDFGQALKRAARTAQNNMHNDAPPPYTPTGEWHQAPIPSYQPPPGYYGWLPNNENFNQGPPPNSVFMSDNPPPYPGLATPGQGQAQGFVGGFVPPQQGGYPGAPPPYGYQGQPQQGGNPNSQQQGGYPNGPQSGGYPNAPQQAGYPNWPQQGYPAYPGIQPGYPPYGGPQQTGYPGYPGQQPSYPTDSNNPNAGGYPGANFPQPHGNFYPNLPSSNPVNPSAPNVPNAPYPGTAPNIGYNPNQPNPAFPAMPTGGFAGSTNNTTAKEAEAALSAQNYAQNNAVYNSQTYSGSSDQNQNLGAYAGQNANSSGGYAAPPCMNGPPPHYNSLK